MSHNCIVCIPVYTKEGFQVQQNYIFSDLMKFGPGHSGVRLAENRYYDP